MITRKAKDRVRKLLAVMMSAMLVLSLTAISAFGDTDTGTGSENTNAGTITIEKAAKDQEYKVYKVFDATSDGSNISYRLVSGKNSAPNCFEVDSAGNVKYVGNGTDSSLTSDDISNIASYVTEGDLVMSVTASSVGSLELSVSGPGYYYITTTTGTVVTITSAKPTVTVQDKNGFPTNVKTVKEDSTNNYSDKNDAGIGQIVSFQSTITAQAGAQNYVFHDKMDAGLTYGSVTGITLNDAPVGASNYEVKTQAADLEGTDPCTFHVVFNQTFCDTLKANDKIVISYTATVNENAVVGSAGNKNESWLKYGENNDLTTTPSETTTYTWDVDVFKYTEGEEDDDGKKLEVALSGATFTLSKNSDGNDPIALLPLASQNDESDGEGDGNASSSPLIYRVAKTGENNTVTKITTDATGKFTIKGLDSDTYYLTETAAPAGYNKLSGPITIVIDGSGNTKVDNKAVDEVKVLNNSGSELPSTGGMGTTVLYVVGGILVVGAGIALYVRRRMKTGEQA